MNKKAYPMPNNTDNPEDTARCVKLRQNDSACQSRDRIRTFFERLEELVLKNDFQTIVAKCRARNII